MNTIIKLLTLASILYSIPFFYKELKTFLVDKKIADQRKPFLDACEKAQSFPMSKISWDSPEVKDDSPRGSVVQGPATITIYDEDGNLLQTQLFPKSEVHFPNLEPFKVDNPQDVTKTQAIKKIECVGYQEKYDTMQVQYESGMTVSYSNY